MQENKINQRTPLPTGEGTSIERIEITAFAGLKDIVVEPKDGINLFTAPNESGKTTLAAFIKFIFYGFAGTRNQSISENERKKFLPWDLQHVDGAIVLKTSRGRYRIERTYALPSRDNVKIIDMSTGRQVFDGLCPGEKFFGVGEDVFSKSVFFRQLTVSKSGDAELAEQLRNLIFSADEQTSMTKAQKSLKDARNSLVSRTNGKIPALRREYEELALSFEKAESQNTQIFFDQRQLNRVKVDVAEKRKKLDIVEAEKENLQNYAAKLRLEGYEQKEREIKQAEAELNELKKAFSGSIIPEREQIASIEEKVRRFDALELSIKENKNELHKSIEEYNDLCEENPLAYHDIDSAEITDKYSKLKSLPITFMAFAIISGIFSGIAYYFHAQIGSFAPYIVYGLAGIAGVFGVLFIINLIKFLTFGRNFKIDSSRKTSMLIAQYPSVEAKAKSLKTVIDELEKRDAERNSQLSNLMNNIKAELKTISDEDVEEEFTNAVKDLSVKASDARMKQMLFEQEKATLETLYKNTDMQKLAMHANLATKPNRDEAEIEREYKFLSASLNSLLDRERECSHALAASSANAKNPAEVAGKRDSIKRKLDSLEEKAQSLEAAMDMLKSASDYMKSTISPKLTEYASELFEKASLGRYRTLELDNSLNMTYTSRIYTKSSDFMSSGTRDSAYLSFRLALAKLLFQDNVPPLVLDDAFSNLDDNRLGAMLGIIAAYGEQVFIFSCQDREKKILSEKKIEFSELELIKIVKD